MRVVSVLAAVVLTGACAIAIARASSAPSPRASVRLTPEERVTIAARLAAQESSWRARAEEEFPGDNWSQDDHFHNLEQMAIRREASRAGVSIGEVLLAIDEGLRRDPEGRPVSPAPCKPRPFYQ